MSTLFWCALGGACCLTSFSFLAGATFSYLTKREQFIASELLGQAAKEFLRTCDAAEMPFDERSLAPLREAIRLLEDMGALPKNPATDSQPQGGANGKAA
jgi:hypothetical protein